MSSISCSCADDKIQEIMVGYPAGRRETLIPILQDVQAIFGYLPEESLAIIGKYIGVSTSKVFGVATFYNQFRLKPVGKHTVRVCRGTACHVRGSKLLLDAFAEELKIQPGDTTDDGQFTLETVACLGACSIAPVVMIDESFHGSVQSRNVKSILKEYTKD
ncbi:MAG: NADH-quinone oxidoreductase subunit NuoE [bacterium]